MHTHQVRREFDRIARLPEPRWSHNIHYEERILEHLSPPLDYVLEVGCGQGRLSQSFSKRCNRVVGIDVAPQMIRTARSHCSRNTNIELICDDYLDRRFPRGQFDAIVSVATVHQIDLVAFLRKARRELVTGGKLIIVDLYRHENWADHIRSIVVRASSVYMHLKYNGTALESRAHRQLWHTHGRNDNLLTLSEVRKTALRMLPGCDLQRLFYWRYWLYWEKV